MSRARQRVLDVPGHVLHTSAWRETSLLVQAFTESHGRMVLVAKGAKRPYSALRPVLLAFQPLRLSWSGGGEVRTLVQAESGPVRQLGGRALMAGWYLNELILRLLPREDPHPDLYAAYAATLDALAAGAPASHAASLRRFEWHLLEWTGYGLGEPMPAFDDPVQEPGLRRQLRARLDALMDDRPMRTRQVLQDLARY